MMDEAGRRERTPGAKFLFAGLIGLLLAIPLFSVYLLVYDRQSQSETARASIAEGWGGPQTLAGPFLVIPYRDEATETVVEAGRPLTRSRDVWRELVLSPEVAQIDTQLSPERRQRSIYEAVVYEAAVRGQARFTLPADLARYGVALDRLALDRAELRFGLSDARGLFGAPPRVSVAGRALPLQPGKGPAETAGSGFYAPLDANALRAGPLAADFAYAMRGNGWLAVNPQAGDTRWTIASPWPHPSFQGGFLPATRRLDDKGFLMFDVIGGVAVASVEYLLVGVGLVLFFVLLLALAEVIGFTAAYLLASAAIIGQITAYSTAVLKSRTRAVWVGGLLVALYAVLYILLSLEAYSLLIGSLMLFVALGAVMFVTRRVDWTGKKAALG
jgi:inner membrane protein